jgi:F-type H+-transporting ATPase subunit delta
MSGYRVASRYAKSVFDLAIELNLVDQVYHDMLLVEKVCAENRSLVTVLKNPIIRYDYKLKVLNKIFDKHISKLTSKFFGLLCRKNRASVLPDTSEIFVAHYHDYKGIIRASVTSAVKLPANLQKDFEAAISKATGMEVELTTKLDETIIGGYVLQVGDDMIDNSLKNKLDRLRRSLKTHH